MGLTQHIHIQTKTGYARITLNQSKLLITYYVHRLPIDYAVIDLENESSIYRDGWNLDNLQQIVRTCEP